MVKNLTANAEDVRHLGVIPGSGRSLGTGNGNPLWYSCLKNSKDRGAWWVTVHGMTCIIKDHSCCSVENQFGGLGIGKVK